MLQVSLIFKYFYAIFIKTKLNPTVFINSSLLLTYVNVQQIK